MSNTTDMTVGNPTKHILTFAIPIMLGNLFQQLYSMVDTIVVGRVEGVEALAAVGSASWLDWFVLGIVMGFAQGFSILAAQRFGAQDYKGLRKCVAMSVILSIIITLFITIAAEVLAMPVLRLLQSPEETIHMSFQYLSIIFAGASIVMAYNLLSGILRALGDSLTPLIAMIAASLINIGLDILFVAEFKWGVRGVAIATVMAQCCASLICLFVLLRIQILHLNRNDWRLDQGVIKSLIRLGIPVAFQNAIIAIGGMVLQYIVNGFGFIFIAGFTAAQKLCGMMELLGSSLSSAMATFAGQNMGAQKYHRIRTGMDRAVRISVCLAFLIGLFVIIFGRNIVTLFITGEASVIDQVVGVAYPYLVIMGVMQFVLYLLFMYRSTLQGMGDTIIPMCSGFAELVMRVAAALILPIFLGEWGVYIAEVAAWFGAALLLVTAYYIKINKLDPRT